MVATHPDSTKAEILVVDDIPNNLRLLSAILTEQGYKVRKASNGRMALDSVRITLPELILLDINMPDLNGYEVCEHLKANEKTRQIPIIFISALDDVFDKVKAFTIGGSDYITKPFKREEVVARIENQLSIWRLQGQLEEKNAQLNQQNSYLQQEIRDRQLLEEMLFTSEAKMRSFFEAMTDIILILTLAGNTIENIEIAPTNPGRFYPEELNPVSQTIEQFFQNGISAAWLSQIQQAIKSQKTVDFDYSLSFHEDELWFAVSISPISDNSVIWIARNITGRKQAEEALCREREKSEALLLNILPRPIAEKLKQNSSAIAEQFDEVTILFADIVGFTPLAACTSPIKLVQLLNQIFSTFDQLAEHYGLEKIKTLGDAYMVVGGLPVPKADHTESVADMALEMQRAISHFRRDVGEPFQMRIGINTGSVVAGVIGIKKFSYDLWGDAVNIAARMEASGMPGRIQVTLDTYLRLKDKYYFEERGAIAVKGKGKMLTYWLTGKI